MPVNIDPKQFNATADALKLGIHWTDNGDGVPQPAEITGENADRYVGASGFKKTFAPMLNTVFAEFNKLRAEAVHKELQLTYVRQVKTDLDAWFRENTGSTQEQIEHYKKGLKELIAVADVFQTLFQRQVGYTEELKKEALHGLSDEDRELIRRYGYPWCVADQGPLCNAIPSLPDRSSGVYLDGVTCKEAEGDFLTISNPFTVVKRDEKGEVISVPYAVAFKDGQLGAAQHLRLAAASFEKIPREEALAEHLLALALAMESGKPFPYVESDRTWIAQGMSDSVILFRAGADEVSGYGAGDNCETKARFHATIGLKNNKSHAIAGKKEPYFQKWENDFTGMIGDVKLYIAQKAIVSLPQFFDVIYAMGDDIGGPEGTSVGQTLPNQCGEDGIAPECPRRVMIFTNKTVLAYDGDLLKDFVLPLFNPGQAAEFSAGDPGLENIVGHEIAHNLGPQPGMARPGSSVRYEETMGDWKETMGELKAEVGGMYIDGDMLKNARAEFKSGKIDAAKLAEEERYYRQIVLYGLVWSMCMLMRVARDGKFEGENVYANLAAVQIGYLTEQGALTYDDKGQWTINFEDDRFLKGVERLLDEVLKLYSEGNLAVVDKFVKRYTEGDGYKLLHADRIVESAGQMPSVLLDYLITGFRAL